MGCAYSATADGGVRAFPASGSFSPQMNSCLPGRVMLFLMGKGGAGEGNRTLVVSLGSFCSAIELHPPSGWATAGLYDWLAIFARSYCVRGAESQNRNRLNDDKEISKSSADQGGAWYVRLSMRT